MGNHEIKSDIERSVNSADRLKAVVDAYWSMSDPRSSDMNFLRETLRNKLEIQDPSDAQLKIVFVRARDNHRVMLDSIGNYY